MRHLELPAYEAAILARLVGIEQSSLSRAAAKGILSLTFGPLDKDRMDDLASKARAGALTSDEEREIEAYSRVSSLIGILRSKARRALKQRGVNGKAKTH